MRHMEQEKGFMTQPDIIQIILKDSSYPLNLFTEKEKNN